MVATQQVADMCAKARVRRLVVASSSSVYGDSGRGLLGEDGPARPSIPIRGDEVGRRAALDELLHAGGRHAAMYEVQSSAYT